MSTRSSIYYRHENGSAPGIHVYREMLEDAPDDVHLEITLPYVLVNIVLPVDLQEIMGIPE